VSASYSISQLPIFARAGAVLVMLKQLLHLPDCLLACYLECFLQFILLSDSTQPLRTPDLRSLTLGTAAFSDPLVWAVFAGPDHDHREQYASVSGGNVTVTEDDGATLRFEAAGAVATTSMAWTRTTTADATSAVGSGGSGGGDFIMTVEPTVGDWSTGAALDTGHEYGGAGADLQQLAGAFATAADCSAACGAVSNCAFWTLLKAHKRCTLKVSRRGRRPNAGAVSGAAPRKMPSTRTHGFQLRAPASVTAGITGATANGKALPKIPPPSQPSTQGAQASASTSIQAGWYVQPQGGERGLSAPPPGALVVFTAPCKLSERLEIRVSSS